MVTTSVHDFKNIQLMPDFQNTSEKIQNPSTYQKGYNMKMVIFVKNPRQKFDMRGKRKHKDQAQKKARSNIASSTIYQILQWKQRFWRKWTVSNLKSKQIWANFYP